MMKADVLTLEEEEQLWTKDVLGGNNAVSSNHTVFFMLSQHFEIRGCQEHHQLHVEDLKFMNGCASGYVGIRVSIYLSCIIFLQSLRLMGDPFSRCYTQASMSHSVQYQIKDRFC